MRSEMRGRAAGLRRGDRGHRPRDRVRIRPEGASLPDLRGRDSRGVRPPGFVVRAGVCPALPVTFELGLFTAPGLPPAPWSWITFEFVHASETHIFLNLLGLILISPTLEERIGSVRWAMLFFVGGAAGALVFLLVHFGDVVLLVGASAGIFAVFGAYGRLYPRDRIALFLPIPGIPTLPVVEVVVIFLVLE